MKRYEIIKTLQRLLTVNQKEVEAVREAIEILMNTEWRDPEIELPETVEFVHTLVSGRAGGEICKSAPFIASYYPTDGWLLENVEARVGDSWTVDAWMPIQEWPEGD